MGYNSEHTGLLRILLADEDDANAFLFQCGVNRLGRPCAFQRVNNRAVLAEKLELFRPNILIAAGTFADPDQIKEIKQFTNGHPIICAVETIADGHAALNAGANDCVLKSQVDELHTCIEWHLNGESEVPYFKKDLIRERAEKKSKGPSRLDLKLAEFDRWVGANLRRLATVANSKARKLLRVSKVASLATAREFRRCYKEVNIRCLLSRQKKLIQSKRTAAPASAVPLSQISPVIRESESKSTETIRVVARTKSVLSNTEPLPAAESFDKDTLRTLELSFKTLFHTSLDPMFLVDGLGSILHANAPACALVALSPADLLGKTILEFVPVAERAQVSGLWEALLIEGQQKAEIRFQSAAGDVRDVFMAARSNLWFGVHLFIARDQTELKRLRAAARTAPAQPNITTPPPDLAAPGSLPCESTQAP